jgi:hypothetical protein
MGTVFPDLDDDLRERIGQRHRTVAHLKQNGRIVVMFCAFAGPPKVLRVHGRGEVVEMAAPRFEELFARFSLADEARISHEGRKL